MLEVNPYLLLVTVVIFLGLIFVLNNMLYKPILSFIDDRNAHIAKEESEVAKYGADIKKYDEEAAQILADARAQMLAVKKAAATKANEAAKICVDTRKAELENEYKEFEIALKKEQEDLKAELGVSLPAIKESLKSTLSKL